MAIRRMATELDASVVPVPRGSSERRVQEQFVAFVEKWIRGR